jgi:hypothetical protein
MVLMAITYVSNVRVYAGKYKELNFNIWGGVDFCNINPSI